MLPILFILGLENIYPPEHFLIQSVLPQSSGLRKWCHLIKFGHKMNLKGFIEVSTIKLNGEVNFFIREPLEAFYFPSVLLFRNLFCSIDVRVGKLLLVKCSQAIK